MMLFLVLSASLLASLSQARCGGTAPVVSGRCLPYSGVCSPIIGNAVWSNETFPIPDAEQEVVSLLVTLRKNKGLVGPDCIHASDWYACAEMYWPCVNDSSSGQGVPLLPCVSDCGDWWGTCRSAFDLYLASYLHGDSSQSSITMCANDSTYTTFINDPSYVPDTFGGRQLPFNNFWPLGYNGTLRWPYSTASYVLPNGSSITTQCYHPVKPAANTSLVLPITVTCTAPLLDGVDGQGNPSCIVPCPFPVFTPDEVSSVQLAFIVPGCLGLALCCFVLFDSLWLLFEYTNGFQMRRLRKFVFWSSGGAPGGPSSQEDNANKSPGGGSKANATRRRPIRATTLYTLVGSVLSIVYFFVGPFPSLVRGASVSCGTSTGFPTTDLNIGNGVDLSDSFCRAQRYSPFILQLVFNLVLFTTVKVFEVVNDKYKRLPASRKQAIAIGLNGYCFGLPIVFLISAAAIEGTPTEVNSILSLVIRQASICIMRIDNPAVEFVLLFLPFITTGALVSAMSTYVFVSIRRVRDKVAGTFTAQNAETERSMRLLMSRLSGLGLGTFCLLLVLIITTVLFELQVNQFAPLWVTWSECIDTAFSCNVEDCAPLYASALLVRPTAALMGTQLASMSCITLVFGLFFTMQSLARLSREYRTGELGAKWRRLVVGGSSMRTGDSRQTPGVLSRPAEHAAVNDSRFEIKSSALGTYVESSAGY